MNNRLLRNITVFLFIINPSLFEAQLPSYLPTNGLVAWYPFNGNANDESGNGNNGSLGNVLSALDRSGQPGGAFDMNTSYIDLSSNIRILNGQNHTIGAWVKINNIEETRLFSQRSETGYEGAEITILSNTVWAYYGTTGNNFQWSSLTPNGIPLNQYLLIICVIDKVSGILSTFVNGNFTGSFNISNINGVANSSTTFIGKRPNVNSACSFTIDEFFFYNRAVTPNEINSIYQLSNPTSYESSAPPGIPYQAEVRNESGDVLANANVNIRFTLHELTANGAVSYQETHALATNELGLFAATIGAGTAAQGTFASINWSQTTKFLQVEVDAGNGYITMGNQQLMSVPYALYAANGPVGPQGLAGADGAEGAMGQQGPPGAQGPVGPQGIQGATGPTGLTGTQGPQGTPGTNGADGVGIASVTTSGSNLVITLTNGQIQTVPFPTAPSSTTGSNANTLIYTVNGF